MEVLNEFNKNREWDQFHTPKNLVMAIAGECGELCELYQWEDTADKEKLEREVADIAIYLLLLCEKTDIDLIESIYEKIAINRIKYPVELFIGLSKKSDIEVADEI